MDFFFIFTNFMKAAVYITTLIYFASIFYCLIYDVSLEELMLNDDSDWLGWKRP